MLSLLRRAPAAALASRVGVSARRTLCEGVEVDMVCRVWSAKVKDDPTAHKMDIAFEDFLDAAAEVDGVTGASRLVCKEHWDYKLILKFEDMDSLKNFLDGDHPALNEALKKEAAPYVVGEMTEQNFVYDDIE